MESKTENKGWFLGLVKNGDYILAAAMFAVVIVLILPVPKAILDSLLVISVGTSILILLVIIYVREPIQLTVFPSILLIMTLYRLALNVASTRLILLDADAGRVIESFGQFVVGGNYVVGAVVFLILVLVNFLVITKGAGRIAEVAARFTLDAMPGKQMAIDAELNAGAIDEKEAQTRRAKVQQEADFYGKMDGASKFVRGDAVAGILITLINIIGGLSIGMMQRDMNLDESLRVYTLLSIGDGLVSQIPALVLSFAAGLLITRTSGRQNLGSTMARQLGFYPRALGILGGVMCFMAILPGMPKIPFLSFAAIAFILSILMKKRKLDATRFAEVLDEVEEKADSTQGSSAISPDRQASSDNSGQTEHPGESGDLEKMLDIDTLSVELGYSLLRLADEKKGGDLVERVTGLRKTFAKEVGLLLPTVSLRDNFELEANDYCFLLRGKPVARGRILPNRSLAMNVSGSKAKIPGEKTKEPVFGLDAIWVDENGRKIAEMNGFTVVDAASVLCTHLSETFRRYAHEILDRQTVQRMVDHTRAKHPALIEELFPEVISTGLLQGVLANLLRENVSIRNLNLILESMGDMALHSKNVNDLSEHARRRLAPYIINQYESEPGKIKAITLDPRLEQYLLARVQRTQFEVSISLDPGTAHDVLGQLTRLMTEMNNEGQTPLIVVMQELRLGFKRFFESTLSRLVVISYQEIPPNTEIENYGIVQAPASMEQERAKNKAEVGANA
ncbi:MAG: flagellar biosynthesis protein FlhA [Opitutales bacterium]|nr:flagellar biosynthesis protein FlhA [Opitutales bacterium]